MRKIRICFALFLVATFLLGVYAFNYGWPSFVEHVYEHEMDGEIYIVSEFVWIKDSLYNYGMGLVFMVTSLMLLSIMWFQEHDDYETMTY